MNSFQIRKSFLDYFAKNNHTVVSSSPLIPAQDPTILFTNAGMNQFKDLFLGREKRSYVRATSSQKCVRAGGKHNDLDAVGFTERHLTFFEMLGNFSFGDYFKKEAISFAWEFLTKEIAMDSSKLYASVYKDDQEAYDLWHTMIGLPESRIIRLGEKDNFWQMGDTGPCGPCTEIYVDRGATKGCGSNSCAPGCDCSRFTEIWNLVFMQYDRQKDGSLVPLKQTGVDTGMGLERLCMIMNGKDTVYDTDLFQHLIAAIEKMTGKRYEGADAQTKAAFRVMCDHIRSTSLLIADGCTPSNEGRGYVLRKIIRRGALFTQKLTPDLETFVKLSEVFIEQLGVIYPELVSSKPLILNLLKQEIEKFQTNLVQGQNIMAKYIADNKKAGIKELTGEQVFKLYDTYGFPPELTLVIANENSLALDMDGFDAEMKKQQEQSGKKDKTSAEQLVVENIVTKFVGYETTECTSSISFVRDDGDYLWIITDESPFYVESGGQVNDSGHVTINNIVYPVVDLQKVGETHNPAIAVKLKKSPEAQAAPAVKIGATAACWVDPVLRANTVKNHTATHMLQAALLQVVGNSIKQAGSLVCPDYLRFDFSHHEALTPAQIEAVENLINEKIRADIKTNIGNTTLAEAKERGVISFFGEKYNPENVRVVQIPGFSAELCGGTHASSTGIIGCFKIVSEAALSSGTRRMVAVTGPAAMALFQKSFSTVKTLSEQFKVKPEEVLSAVQRQNDEVQNLTSTIKQLKKQLAKFQATELASNAEIIKNLPFIFAIQENASGEELRTLASELEKHKPGLYVLIGKESSRFSFLCSLSKQYESSIDMKALAAHLKDAHNLRGGGSNLAIQGGGTNLPQNFKEALISWLNK